LRCLALDFERTLQREIEQHLPEYLGVRLLASEYSTGKTHGGRIDTLGIDQNGCPVIIEFKRTQNSNVINQGLFYLDWLLDHRADFAALVSATLGPEALKTLDWSNPRLICMAGNFTRYDEHAVQLIARNIDLIRYRKYGASLVLLELINRRVGESIKPIMDDPKGERPKSKTFAERLAESSPELRSRFDIFRQFALGLSEEVWMKERMHAVDFRLGRGRDFVNVATVWIADDEAIVGAILDTDEDFTITCDQDLESAKPLIRRSYEQALQT
jgi:hypothetical protein